MVQDVYIVDRTQEPRGWARLSPSHWARTVGEELRELWRDRHVIAYQVVSDLKARYQYSFLGVLWSLLNPILMLLVLAVVFSQVLQRRTVDMTFFLFAGLVPWTFFNRRVSAGSKCLVSRAALLSKLRINMLVFQVAGLLDEVITFVLTLGALLALLVGLLGMPVPVQAVALPACVAVLAVFSFGLSMLMMVLLIYFRDIEHLLDVVLRGWYFLTPVLYPLDRITNPVLLRVLHWNPMTHIVTLFRCCLYYGRWPSPQTWLAASGASLSVLIAGYVAYRLRSGDLLYRL